MSNKSKPPLFIWREKLLESDLQSTTKHVLLTLACHMNDNGGSCYPTIAQICKETSLSNRAVITHIHKAEEQGWIKTFKRGSSGQRWANHEYKLSWAFRGDKAVNVVHDLNEKVVNLVPEVVNVVPKAVNEVHTSTSISTSIEREVYIDKRPLSPSISWHQRKTDCFGPEYQPDTQQPKLTRFPRGKFKLTDEMLEYGNSQGLSDEKTRQETRNLSNKATAGGWLKEDWLAYWYAWIDMAAERMKQGAYR